MYLYEVLPAVIHQGQTAVLPERFTEHPFWAQIALFARGHVRFRHGLHGTYWQYADLSGERLRSPDWLLLGPVALEDIPEPEVKP